MIPAKWEDYPIIYGSRAKGTHRPGSDIDLSIFKLINHAGLREHIERVGQVFYQP